MTVFARDVPTRWGIYARGFAVTVLERDEREAVVELDTLARGRARKARVPLHFLTEERP